MENWRNQPWVFWTFLLPGLVWLLVFFLVPLGFIWTIAFGERSGPADIIVTWTWSNYIQALDPIYLGLFFKSFWIAAVATALCLVLSFPVALAVSFAPARVKPLLLMLVILPFWTNLLIRTYALIVMLRTNGYINKGLEGVWDGINWVIGGALGDFTPLEMMNTDFAVVFGMVYVFLPFTVLPLYAALERLDHSFIEASLDLGAGQLRTFKNVIVPLAAPGIASAVVITFIPALGTFLQPDLLGGTDSSLIANVIERQFRSANDWPFGSALSFMLLYITFFAIAAQSLMGRRRKLRGVEK